MESLNLDSRKAEKILILVGISFCVGMAVVLVLNPVMPFRSDLLPRWYATRQWLLHGRNLYDPQNGIEVFEKFSPYIASPEDANFYYPAHLVIFTLVLALLPYHIAHLVWTFLVQFFYLASLWIVMDMLKMPGSFLRRTLVMITAVLFIPAFQQTIWSQFNTLALFSLVLAIYCLKRERYTLGGMLLVGVTLKPQALLLSLILLLLWSLFDRRRWNFFISFVVAMLVTFILTLIAQPGWLGEFFRGLRVYRTEIGGAVSVLERIWDPSHLLSAFLLLSALYLFIRNRHSSIDSAAFAGCIGLSIGCWFLVVPIIGTLHLVALPVAAIFIAWSLRALRHPFYRLAVSIFVVLYLIGWTGFLVGLLSSGPANLHVVLMEIAYKFIAPALIALIALAPTLYGEQRGALLAAHGGSE